MSQGELLIQAVGELQRVITGYCETSSPDVEAYALVQKDLKDVPILCNSLSKCFNVPRADWVPQDHRTVKAIIHPSKIESYEAP